MKHWIQPLPYHFDNILSDRIFTEDTIFFDIETTGFSPAHTMLYLIGCATRKDDKIVIEQFFADTPEDEPLILASFLSLLEKYGTIITFNGIGFDIPYLKAKCTAFQFEEPFSKKNYIDIFQFISSYKFLLKLPNYKQKSLEAFLGIGREDLYNGGELIQVYKEYQKQPNEELLFLLKQHNFEDVLGMPGLLTVFGYQNFFEGDYSVTSLKSNAFTDAEGRSGKELIVEIKNHIPLPRRVSCRYEDFYLLCSQDTSRLSIRLYDGTLKFFYPDYQNYYYLPNEDTAIHKSVSGFVDKEYRKKATASTCYTKKNSLFVPQFEVLMEPAFCQNYKDKKTYFELCEAFTNSDDLLHRYIQHVLHLMKTSGKKKKESSV